MAEPRDYSMNIGVAMKPAGTGTDEIIASIQKLRAEYKDTRDITEQLVTQGKTFGETITKGLKDAELSLGKFSTDLRNTVQTINGLVSPVNMIVKEMQSTFAGGAANYAMAAKNLEDTSFAYNNAQRQIDEAQFSMGRSFATIMTPVLEQTAKGMESMANFMEENPELVKAIGVVMAGGVAVMGVVSFFTTVVGTLDKFVIAVKASIVALEGMNIAAALNKIPGVGGLLSKIGVGGDAAIEARLLAGGSAALPEGAALAGGSITAIVGTVVAALAAGAGGLALGGGIMNWASQTDAGKDRGWASGSEGLTVAAKFLGDIFGKGNEWAIEVAHWSGAMDEAQSTAYERSKNADNMTKEEIKGLDLYKSYVTSKKELDRTYQESLAESLASQRRTIDKTIAANDQTIARTLEQRQYDRQITLENFEKQRFDTEKAYQEQRLKATETFEKSQWAAIGSHREAEAKSREQFHEQRIKTEEAYQKQILKMAEDHDTRMSDLANSRDAMGIVKENQRYSKQLTDAEKTHDEGERNAEKEFNKRMKQMDIDFAKQQDKAQQQFAQSARDAEIAHQKQEEKTIQLAKEAEIKLAKQQARQDKLAEENFERQMKTTQDGYDLQNASLERSHLKSEASQQRTLDAQLKALDLWGFDTVTVQRKVLDQMRKDYTSYLESMPGYKGSTPIKKGSGGYAPHGIYELGEEDEDEFVLSGSTTKKLESLFGNKLSQEGLLNLGGRGGSMTLAQNFTFVGSMSESEKMWYQNTARNQAYEAFRDVMEGRIGGLALA